MYRNSYNYSPRRLSKNSNRMNNYGLYYDNEIDDKGTFKVVHS